MKNYNGLSLNQSDVIANSLSIISVVGTLRATRNYIDIADELIDIVHQYLKEATTTTNKQPAPPHASRLGTIAFRIQLARKDIGMSEDDLAEKLNIHPGDILTWEDGTDQPMAGMIIPLATALKCDPMWLLTGNSTHQFPATPGHQSQYHYSGPLRSDASGHASHHAKNPSQA
ncbi:helix-turn-helix domain-containing protein [Salmonella enterica]|nr:helix-turn-helix domain-containing protein [Salmonella enterica]EGL7476514.1 helix-turn-helix domain-containing protein [Salmonella enterica]EIZ2334656.1 helix-turn-helix domain-containing protein [Salmonella enterica]